MPEPKWSIDHNRGLRTLHITWMLIAGWTAITCKFWSHWWDHFHFKLGLSVQFSAQLRGTEEATHLTHAVPDENRKRPLRSVIFHFGWTLPFGWLDVEVVNLNHRDVPNLVGAHLNHFPRWFSNFKPLKALLSISSISRLPDYISVNLMYVWWHPSKRRSDIRFFFFFFAPPGRINCPSLY